MLSVFFSYRKLETIVGSIRFSIKKIILLIFSALPSINSNANYAKCALELSERSFKRHLSVEKGILHRNSFFDFVTSVSVILAPEIKTKMP
jgi:hypothetical protein